ncbi:hypothetical protein AHZ37_000147 [Salmonella enterica subsp. indica]|nr:hypothetical protein [Salmonella enterica subsp. arizonae]ECC3876401.1 hypothetical protein [Salmonella enterica subsp. indica]ECI8270847.1 hypothetical protein [Salmonella enterica subsp. enterica]EDR2770156.1 hypothetical protein [Salmonella enterica subsp. enterica serovar Oslo]EEC4250060.1 hypothetical protein [Salmonella enterica subsp. diarizonae]
MCYRHGVSPVHLFPSGKGWMHSN